MARTIKEIKDTMTADFMANTTVQDLYQLTDNDEFDSSFSAVSLENILFGIFATCVWVLESLFDRHKEEVNQIALQTIVASVEWYHAQALLFQKGDALVYNPTTKGFGYAVVDPSKQIVKYAAIRDLGKSIQVLVSGDKSGLPAKLADDDLTLFTEYMNRVKIAGVVLTIRSFNPDVIRIDATCTIDPLVLNSRGERLDDNSKPVVDAINNYLHAIVYGGTMNKTKLIDAIQTVPGIRDVILNGVSYSVDGVNFSDVMGNDYSARSGSFVSDNIDNTIKYVV